CFAGFVVRQNVEEAFREDTRVVTWNDEGRTAAEQTLQFTGAGGFDLPYAGKIGPAFGAGSGGGEVGLAIARGRRALCGIVQPLTLSRGKSTEEEDYRGDFVRRHGWITGSKFYQVFEYSGQSPAQREFADHQDVRILPALMAARK